MASSTLSLDFIFFEGIYEDALNSVTLRNLEERLLLQFYGITEVLLIHQVLFLAWLLLQVHGSILRHLFSINNLRRGKDLTIPKNIFSRLLNGCIVENRLLAFWLVKLPYIEYM